MAPSIQPKKAENYGADKSLASEDNRQKRRNKRDKFETIEIDDVKLRDCSEISDAEKDMVGVSGEETDIRHQESDDMASIRQRHRDSNAETSTEAIDDLELRDSSKISDEKQDVSEDSGEETEISDDEKDDVSEDSGEAGNSGEETEISDDEKDVSEDSGETGISGEETEISDEEKDVSEDSGETGNSGGETEISGEETEMRHQGSDDVTSIRQRTRDSDAKALIGVSDRGKNSSSGQGALAQTEEASLVREVANDILKGSFKVLRACCPIWKWFVVVYLVWIGLSYLLASVYQSTAAKMSRVCSRRVFSYPIGSVLPFCNSFSDANSRVIDVSKIATSQECLTVVMDGVGENFDLARDMTGHEFAIRDLRIRVAASILSRRLELARELDSLSRYTKRAAKHVSRFTAKVSKSVDAIHTFDKYAVRTLETVAEGEKTPTIPERVLSLLNPVAAFAPSTADQSKEKVKKLFISTANRISNKVQILINDSFELGHNLDTIQETLDQIKELALGEIGDSSRADILKALWNRLARPDDNEQYKSHATLLTDMTTFYQRSSNVVEETIAALNRIEAELGEFRDDYATPGLILTDHPSKVIIELFRKSGHRLETGKRKLESIEERARPKN